MKVRRGEGLASRTSPEPCMALREKRREASAGKTCKPAIVPRKVLLVQDADGEVGRKATRMHALTRVCRRFCVV